MLGIVKIGTVLISKQKLQTGGSNRSTEFDFPLKPVFADCVYS